MSYKDTLNLPSTRFDMKANLTTREPAFQARWQADDLYGQIRKARAGSPRKVLHDGPPYANGEIHMGHLLNKVLKDIVVRWSTMSGYDSPYIPGWDCHGLPIEHKVVKDLGSRAAAMTQSEIRSLCHAEALKWVAIQRDQFRRLGVSGDWENPYLTLDPRYEAGILDVLADLVEKGYIYRQLKPIHWDMHDRTALAEAELEYKEVTSPSIYVNFPVVSGFPDGWPAAPTWHAMIWTTTPWTLPANVAIAVHPDLEYLGLSYKEPRTGAEIHTIVAADRVNAVLASRGITEFTEQARVRGSDLRGMRYRHVFLEREGVFVTADYVSAEDGTGLVHTAPGHGAEDYQTGRLHGLPTISPVDDRGCFTSEAPSRLVGKNVLAANPEVISMLEEAAALFHHQPMVHSYPHGWRSKKPVIFRATDQWFIGVDHHHLRERTLEVIKQVDWHPAWGQSRIEGMVSLRPDWCISRQRAWGVPIPALACEKCGQQTLTVETVRHFRDLFRNQGADAWFSTSVEQLVPSGLTCSNCGGDAFQKASDILDVWFESGASHRAVLEGDYGLGYPAALYLEGSDQHRGWFQSSILTAVGSTDQAPFEAVLTHGFVVDESGRKMAKSEGNAISAVSATETYGADVLRLYVASLDYADDVRVSERGIKEMSDGYRKIRNTFRYFLGNLEDYSRFQPESVDTASLQPIDRWVLGQLNELIRDVTAAYDEYEFYRVFQRIYQFCVVDLSSFYLDLVKDRLYAERGDGAERQAAQYVLARLHDALARLLAPILPHTMEELWDLMPRTSGRPSSVHLALRPEPDPQFDDPARDALWTKLRAIRGEVYRSLEKLRVAKSIGSGQEAAVLVGADDPVLGTILVDHAPLLETLCAVSEFRVGESRPKDAETGIDLPGLWVLTTKSSHPKCDRCWNLRPSVGTTAKYPTLCARCVAVVESLTG